MSSTAKNVLFIAGIDIGGKVREQEDAWFGRWKDEIERIQQSTGRSIRVVTLRFGSTQTIASAAEAALDAVDPAAPLSVVGYSLGGMVAQEVIARTDERNIDLECCILVATSGPVAQGEAAMPETRGAKGIRGNSLDGHALQDRSLLMRAYGVFAEKQGPSETLAKLLDLPSGTRGEWLGKVMQEYGVLSAPARNLVDQLRAATRWLLGWDADARTQGKLLRSARSSSQLLRSARSSLHGGSPSAGGAKDSGVSPSAGGAKDSGGSPSAGGAKDSGGSPILSQHSRRTSPRILIVAPELDELFPAEVHAERVKRNVEGNGFTDVEVIRIADSGHKLQPKGVFTPEDGAHFVMGCGSLPFANNARIVARIYRALPVLFAILVSILFGALISSLARYADILNRKARRANSH